MDESPAVATVALSKDSNLVTTEDAAATEIYARLNTTLGAFLTAINLRAKHQLAR